jgi:NADH dehydrogenase FAD-containing subunit
MNSKMNQYLNSKKYVIVNEFLQIDTNSTIFACGDIIASKEEKLAQLANLQADNIIANIKRLESRQSLLKYVQNLVPGMFVSLGKNKALLLQGTNVLTGVILVNLIQIGILFKCRQRIS